MLLINCKVELKHSWAKHCILAASSNEHTNCDFNNTIFTIKGTKLYVSIVTSSANDNQKLSKDLSKGFQRSVYWTS